MLLLPKSHKSDCISKTIPDQYVNPFASSIAFKCDRFYKVLLKNYAQHAHFHLHLFGVPYDRKRVAYFIERK